MKTTDSVMREKWEVEFDDVFGVYPSEKFEGITYFGKASIVTPASIKSFLSHSLAEARREWVEEMRKSVKGLMLVEWIEHGRDCEEGLRPCGAVEHPDRLADRCDIRHFDPTTIQKVLDLLTGDNPERKV